MRHITENGLKLIEQFEGFSSKIYLDSASLPTIGYGHLITPAEKHLFKNGITEAESMSLLKQDVAIAENAVARLVNTHLNNYQFDALVSFTFNLGSGALQRSTLRAKINREEHAEVPAEFLRWVYANGKKVAGLIKRRKIEANLYES